MQKYSEVVGLPVICAENGIKAGIVKDVVFCPGTREIRALVLERKGTQIRKRVLLVKDILSIGRDAVIINDSKCITDWRKAVRSKSLEGNGKLLGLRIVSKAGEDIGIVKDVLFESKTGDIEGLVISDGLIQDILEGRNILPLFGKAEFSEEYILVDNEALEEMHKKGGGLKNRWLKG
ncbi:MAG: PRC-barrel domain-containing protein [Clostridia bacterium]|nr:PRC-barrel domain-containing protein [Clostridia bacterium]